MLERTLTGQLEVAPLRLRVFVVCLFLIGTMSCGWVCIQGIFWCIQTYTDQTARCLMKELRHIRWPGAPHTRPSFTERVGSLWRSLSTQKSCSSRVTGSSC